MVSGSFGSNRRCGSSSSSRGGGGGEVFFAGVVVVVVVVVVVEMNVFVVGQEACIDEWPRVFDLLLRMKSGEETMLGGWRFLIHLPS